MGLSAGYPAPSNAHGYLNLIDPSHPLEIGALRDGEALEVAAQAVEAELDRAEAHPVAAAIDARAAGLAPLFGRAREMDAAAKNHPGRAVTDPRHNRQPPARARPPPPAGG